MLSSFSFASAFINTLGEKLKSKDTIQYMWNQSRKTFIHLSFQLRIYGYNSGAPLMIICSKQFVLESSRECHFVFQLVSLSHINELKSFRVFLNAGVCLVDVSQEICLLSRLEVHQFVLNSLEAYCTITPLVYTCCKSNRITWKGSCIS